MGRAERHRGVIIRTIKTGEADRTVDILVDSGEMVACIARGVAKSRTRFVGSLEPFTSGVFLIRRGRGRPTLEAVDVPRSRFGIARSVATMVAASCACEWMLKTSREPAEGRVQLDHLEALLDGMLEDGRDHGLLLFAFEIGLLRLAGVLPDISVCAGCGVGFSVQEDVGICSNDGTFVHRGHGGGCLGWVKVDSEVRPVLTCLWTRSLEWCRRLRVSTKQRSMVAAIVGMLLDHHFGVVVKSRGLALQLLAG